MNDEIEPVVGRWYRRLDNDQAFMIVDLDEGEDLIEIELVDGEHDEIEAHAWTDIDVERIDEPDEWAGRPGDIEPDDMDIESKLATGRRDTGDSEDLDTDWDDEDSDDDG